MTIIFVTECWHNVPHERPAFSEILGILEEINCSSFVDTLDDTFRDMQDNWRHEIEDMFEELREKEQV